MSAVTPLSDTPSPTDHDCPDLGERFAALQAAIADLEVSPSFASAVRLTELRRAVADEVVGLNKRDLERDRVPSVFEAVRRLAQCGALDVPVGEEDRQRLADWLNLGGPGLVASMLLIAPWRWPEAPMYSQVPDWMWGEYTRWLFSAPNPLLDTDECAAYAAHVARHGEELARWAQRNLGSAAVRAAVEAFAECAPLHPLRSAGVDDRSAAESCRRVLDRLLSRAAPPHDVFISPRVGRPLRVGFVSRNWELSEDTAAALARLEHQPNDRMERVLFSVAEPVSGFARHCQSLAADFRTLPLELPAQVEAIRAANLDVVVLVGDLTSADEFSRLALFRMAPLQVVCPENAASPGGSAVDLCVVPSLPPPHSSVSAIRLAILPEGASAYASRRGGDPETAYARQDLGFSEDAVVIVAVLSSPHGCGEALRILARILAGAPTARLLLHLRPGRQMSAVRVEHFAALVVELMRQQSVPMDRVAILAPEVESFDESRAMVRLADLVVAMPGARIWTAEALSAGIPVVAADGIAAAWLRAEGLPELVAQSADSLVTQATSLVLDPSRRAAIRNRLVEAAKSGLACGDALAASDAFAGVLETAYDQLEAAGPEAVARRMQPLSGGDDDAATAAIAAAESALAQGDPEGAILATRRALAVRPRDGNVRALHGRAQLAAGRFDLAATYLLAAVVELSTDTDLWFMLASAFRGDGKNSEATQALERSLRLNPRREEGWLMLVELAEMAGATDLARDAYGILKENWPGHPQLPDLAARFEA